MEKFQNINFNKEELEQRKLMNLLMTSPFVRTMLKNNDMNWAVRPSEARELDIAFLKKKETFTSKISPLPIFGLSNCIGVKITKDEKKDSLIQAFKEVEITKYEEFKKSIQSNNLTNHDDVVAVMTPRDITKWISFFDQVESEELVGRLSQKTLIGLSGLERTSNGYRRRLVDSFSNIIRNKESIFTEADIEIKPDYKGMDYAFVKKDGMLGTINLHHVRESQLIGQVLRRTISREPQKIVGAVIKSVGENERETWNRAKLVEERIMKEEGIAEAKVLVVSGGQLSLFEKWGMDRPLKTVLPECSVDLREVMDFLFLGQGNDLPGVLALEKTNFSLTRNLSSYGVDILFEKRTETGGKVLAPIDGVIGLDLKTLYKENIDDSSFSIIDNIAGIVCVPDDYDKPQILERLSNIKVIINRLNVGADINLLPLNSKLFEKWKSEEKITYDDIEKNKNNEEKKHFFYTNGNKEKSSSELRLFPLGPTIGSARILLTVHKAKEASNFIVDWGTTYPPLISLADRSIIGRSTVPALRKMFKNGELPLVPSLYFAPYILMTANTWPDIDNGRSSDIAASYLRSEITNRIPYKEAVEFLGADRAKKIYSLGINDIKRWYGENMVKNEKILFSHSHKDHSGMSPFLEGSSLSSWLTSALLLASSNQANSWFDNFAYQSRIDLPKVGSSYIKVDRKMDDVFYHNQEVNLSEGVSAKFYFTNHSDSGSVAIGLSTPHGKILYSGDIEPGSQTEQALSSISKDEYNNFLWECTNPKLSNKPSTFIKETDVVESFEKVFRLYPKHLIVIAAPHNYLGRLDSVANAIGRSNVERDIYVGLKHADVLNHIRMALRTAPLDATGREFYFPEPGEDIGVYQKPLTTLRRWQRTTLELARGKKIGVVEQKDLKSIRGNSVLVLSPYEFPEMNFGGAGITSKVIYIYSSPFPYDMESKRRVSKIKCEIESEGGMFMADFKVFGDGGRVSPLFQKGYGFHASGHGDFEENMQMLERVITNSSSQKTVYFIHGEKPQIYVKDAYEWFKNRGINNVNFVGTFNHYRPKDPINSPGHVINITS